MQNFNELNHFLTIARAGSFVRAGQLLGISSSALSHSMRNLETRLNLRLFNRTTRNVSLTEAGQQLYGQIAPLFRAINEQVDALGDFLNTPSGTIRINASNLAAETVLYPKLKPLMAEYPQIQIEIQVENGYVDIVKQGYDMGVRLGYDVAKDMVAVKISEPIQMALVASPAYTAQHGEPKTIEDLHRHRHIGMKISAQHSWLTWDFKERGKRVEFSPNPHFAINNHLYKQAIIDGLGIGWLTKLSVQAEIERGELVELLPKKAITYDPLYLYYPSRKGHSSAFGLVVDRLRA